MIAAIWFKRIAACSASVASGLLLSLHSSYTFSALSDFAKDTGVSLFTTFCRGTGSVHHAL
jgi:hypothetical protein